MKKFLTITFSLLVAFVILTGCNNKVDDTDIDNDDEIEESTQGFDGDVDTSWDEVSDDYNAIELEAREEIRNNDNITADDVRALANTIQTKYTTVRNGITSDNEDDAKELYRASIKLQEIAKKDGTRVEHELTTLALNGEAMVKQFYGEAEDDFDDLKEDFENGLESIKGYTEDKWQEFMDLLK